MRRKRGNKQIIPPGDPTDPEGFWVLSKAFLQWLAVKNYSNRTIDSRRSALNIFIKWCDERGLTCPADITHPIIEQFQIYLHYYRKKNGMPLSAQSQFARLSGIRSFFSWLVKNNYILYNPAADIELPKLEQRLPEYVLTAKEAEKVINMPDIRLSIGIRDRAILETFYSTGMRRFELIGLKMWDINSEQGVITIRRGKGKKDRTVPVGERALAWIEKYKNDVRPEFAINPDDGTLFLTVYSDPISGERLTQMVVGYMDAANIGKTGGCHLFRHTMATLMFENGADIRFIQQILGHASIESTKMYTRVSIQSLKKVHTATHPSAKMERKS